MPKIRAIIIRKKKKDIGYDCLYKPKLSDYGPETEEGGKVELTESARRKYEDRVKELAVLTMVPLPVLDDKGTIWKPCEYFDQKYKAVRASHTIYNYKSFLPEIFLAGSIRRRKVVIFDEVHFLEDQIADYKSMSLVADRKGGLLDTFLNRIDVKGFVPARFDDERRFDIKIWIKFAYLLLDEINNFIAIATERLVNNDNSTPIGSYPTKKMFTPKNLKDALLLKQSLDLTLLDIESDIKNWIVMEVLTSDIRAPDISKGGKIAVVKTVVQKVLIQPRSVAYCFKEIFDKCLTSSKRPTSQDQDQHQDSDNDQYDNEDSIDGVVEEEEDQEDGIAVFMSATILSKEQLCKITGLEPDKVAFIRIQESEFPIENRPIYPLNIATLTVKTIEEALPRIVSEIDKIIDNHSNEKGIIHLTSYKQAKYIQDHLSVHNAQRLLVTGAGIDRNELLEKHRRSSLTDKPTVLLSPSFTSGVDLIDDLSRFQIIVKIPYPDLSNRRFKALMQTDPQWYTWKTIVTLVQAYGRSVRSENDHAVTYVLDSKFDPFIYHQARGMAPKWFLDAINRRHII